MIPNRSISATLIPGAALIAGVLIGSLAVSYAQQSDRTKAPSLTALDYIEIQQLGNRYGYALDHCERNGYAYADLYTSDGVFIDSWSELGVSRHGVRWVGRKRLAEAAGGGILGCEGKKKPSLSHIAVNHLITPTAEGASGTVFLISGGGNGDPDVLQRSDVYEDKYVRTPAGWRFKERAHVRDRESGRFNAGVAPRGE
jgi:hypothetical protein